jgi:hypothetical protein
MATKGKGGRGRFSPYTSYVIEGGRIQMVNLDTYCPVPRIVPLIWHSYMTQGFLQFLIKYTLSIKLKIDSWQYKNSEGVRRK